MVYAKNKETKQNEQRYLPIIQAAERRRGIPAGLLHRLLYQESRFRTDIITGQLKSKAGAAGIAQFMPATAQRFGVDPLDPEQAIDGAARYLRVLFDEFKDWRLAVAGYNAGEGNVRKHKGVPPFEETRNYVAQIFADVPAVA